MKNKIKSFDEICDLCNLLQQQGKKVVFVHGCFDILHKGHVNYLEESKKQGDLLIVGLETDNNIKKLKGRARPINNQDERIYVLSSLEHVDYTFMVPDFDVKVVDEFYFNIYKKLNFHTLVTSTAFDAHARKKKERMKELNREIVDVYTPYDKSTTKFIELLDL